MFLLRAAADPASDFWFSPIGGISASGAAVSPDSALRLSVVYACVRVLSEAVAKLPVRMYRGEFDEVLDHPVAMLLRRKPNPSQTSFEWREMLQAHLCLRSNAFSQIVYSGSRVAGLVPLHPDRVTVEQVDDWTWRYRVRDWQGRERVLLQDEVLHLKQTPLDGMTGLSTVAVQREPIGSALSAQQYQGQFFKNGARHSGLWIEAPGTWNEEQKKRSGAQFRANLSGSNAFNTPIMDRGMKLHELGMTNADAQFIESRRYSDSDLCRMFLVPPHMVGILDRATNNNIEHQGREFYNVTLMGLLRRWEEVLETSLLTEDEQSQYRIEFDVDEITRADMATRWGVYHDAVLDGIMTPNEARRREHMAPLDGLDEPMRPMNMTTPGAAPRVPAADASLPAIRLAAADRCVRREVGALRRIGTGAGALERVADFYGTHADWMARVLGAEYADCARYCEARFDELRASRDHADTLDAMEHGGGALLLSRMTE